ncbi:MAG TPA: ATP-binding cassette domain-containing protein, partial [Candidatus Krumholzibacteria bacterium]|nr:ATP-binding cassette domain-containing protein [Candidatus Krumholzibacteria bacterium]
GVLPLRSGSQERTSGLRVALLLQDPDDQMVASSVEHELVLSVPLDVDAVTRRTRIAAAIERFELGEFLARNPHRLSGGEKQRLAFATAWLEDPDVLLLDEPLSFLDEVMRERVISFVREMNANGTAVVWATPGGDDVELAQRVMTLRDGRIADRAIPHEPVHDIEVSPRAFQRSARVTFDAVSFSYDKRRVIDEASLVATAGQRILVTGRNGSGKSTLLLLAGGAIAPSSGRITRAVEERGVMYLPQSPERLFFAETVMEEICFGLERRGLSIETARQRAEEALNRVGLDAGHFAQRSPFELSFGEMRRVAFAIASALDPDLLLLDEPATGLDARGRAVLESLVGHAAGRGAAVIVASHERGAALACDRMLELKGGTLFEVADAHTP